MADGVSTLGWRVYRTRRGEFLDPARTRRRTLVAGIVGSAAGAATVVSDALTDWLEAPVPIVLVTAAAFAAALGCFAAALVRTRRSADSALSPRSGDWRRSDRVDRQFTARPPELRPEDRDEVLAQASRIVGPAVVAVDRLGWLPLGWLAAWIGALASGVASSESVTPLLVPLLLGLIQGATWVAAVVSLGRAERTRRRVEATPPAVSPPPVPRPRPRNAEPRGSKLGLPEEHDVTP